MGRRKATKRQPISKATDATVTEEATSGIEDLSRLISSIDAEGMLLS